MSTSNAAANRVLYIGLGLGITIISGALSYLLYKYLKRDAIPEISQRVGTLQQINIFPIKSCAPLPLTANDILSCGVFGLRFKNFRDRAFMLVDNNHEMVTIDTNPRVYLISCQLVGDTKLVLTADGMEPLQIDCETLTSESSGRVIDTSVWGFKMKAMLCGEKYDKWLSVLLLERDSGIHLVHYVYYPPESPSNAHIIRSDSGTFHDAASYFLINLSTLENLNGLVPFFIDPLQFRGNFHIINDTYEPFVEDNWQWVRIGEDAIFKKVAPGTRITTNNINARKGGKNPDANPLGPLGVHMVKSSPIPKMGIYLRLMQTGSIKLNDVVYVK